MTSLITAHPTTESEKQLNFKPKRAIEYAKCSADTNAVVCRLLQAAQQGAAKNSLLALAVVPQELQRSAAEDGESRGIIVAPIDAASPDRAIAGLQKGGGQALHLPPPHFDLDVVEEEVARLREGVYLQGVVGGLSWNTRCHAASKVGGWG